jgi:hypothetical protein
MNSFKWKGMWFWKFWHNNHLIQSYGWKDMKVWSSKGKIGNLEMFRAIFGIIEYCRYPVDRVPPHTSLSQDMEQGVHPCATTCPAPSDLASLLRWAPVPQCVLRLRTSPPCRGRLQCCHVSHGLGPRLLAKVSSGTVTCISAPDPASLPRWASTLPRVPCKISQSENRSL